MLYYCLWLYVLISFIWKNISLLAGPLSVSMTEDFPLFIWAEREKKSNKKDI